LPPGTTAPDFSLQSSPQTRLTLRACHGSPLVLVFYPADFSPVCTDELALFNELLPEFESHSARVVGISVDGVWCHRAFASGRKLHFALLADFFPHGEVSRSYRAFDEGAGVSKRALYVIDASGTVSWSYLSPMEENPGADGVLDALDRVDQAIPSPEARH
jgi:peroxiredoxin